MELWEKCWERFKALSRQSGVQELLLFLICIISSAGLFKVLQKSYFSALITFKHTNIFTSSSFKQNCFLSDCCLSVLVHLKPRFWFQSIQFHFAPPVTASIRSHVIYCPYFNFQYLKNKSTAEFPAHCIDTSCKNLHFHTLWPEMRHYAKILGLGINSKVTARKALCAWFLCVLGRQQWGVCVRTPGNGTPTSNCPTLGVKGIPVTSHLMGKGKGWLTPEQTQWWDTGLNSPRLCSNLSQKPEKTEKNAGFKTPWQKAEHSTNVIGMALGATPMYSMPCVYSQGIYWHRKSMGWSWCSWWLQVELAALPFDCPGSAVRK